MTIRLQLLQQGWLWPTLAGPFAGSFLGLLAQRLPQGRSVVLARSECDACHTRLGPHELVPVLSFILQRGRCRRCEAAIGMSTLVMELGCTALTLWAASIFTGNDLWLSALLGWMLLALSLCDIVSLRLPDVLTLSLLLFGLGMTAWKWPPSLADHALAAALGYGLFRLIDRLYWRLRGRRGLGGGDAKLMAAAGAWVGLAGMPIVLLLSALAGLGIAVALALRDGWEPRRALPFGQCLALGLWIVWLYG